MSKFSRIARTFLLMVAATQTRCVNAPTVMTPLKYGSIGSPSHGVQTDAAELPKDGTGYFWLRNNDRHYALPRFVHAIERAAAGVATARPGSLLGIGDFSVKGGGQLMPHWSHRTGRDVDLLFYMQTLSGAHVPSPDFIVIEPDGLGFDKARKRFLRLDVEREWLLVKQLVTDDEARVQWIFCHRNVAALLLEWAFARGESTEVIYRAASLLHEPNATSGLHDDHLHVRTECDSDETAGGCITGIPHRPWLSAVTTASFEPAEIETYARELFQPLLSTK
jgi:penicillin-insensitive murein DD-endopeptidase